MCNTEQRRRGSSDGLIISYRFRPLLDGFDARRDDFAVLCIEQRMRAWDCGAYPLGSGLMPSRPPSKVCSGLFHTNGLLQRCAFCLDARRTQDAARREEPVQHGPGGLMGIMDRPASSLGHVGGMPNKSIRSPRAHRLCHRSKRYRAHGKDQQKNMASTRSITRSSPDGGYGLQK